MGRLNDTTVVQDYELSQLNEVTCAHLLCSDDLLHKSDERLKVAIYIPYSYTHACKYSFSDMYIAMYLYIQLATHVHTIICCIFKTEML